MTPSPSYSAPYEQVEATISLQSPLHPHLDEILQASTDALGKRFNSSSGEQEEGQQSSSTSIKVEPSFVTAADDGKPTSIVSVYSCKGGVGKSTIALNLAYALSSLSPHLNIGLLDLDIYGPSLPVLLPDIEDKTVRE
jgi:Mrp family chromosome partitioning ATPase